MARVAEVGAALQRVLSEAADQAARATKSVQRCGKLSGAGWVQALVLGWLGTPDASLRTLCRAAGSGGVAITPQGLDQRFTAAAAACLERVLHAAVQQTLRAAEPVVLPLLARFAAVVVQDSTTVSLPSVLAEQWRGCGGDGAGAGAAALKAQVGLDLCHGTLVGPTLADGRTPDTRLTLRADTLPAGALLVQDLGYFDVAALAALGASGRFWPSRLKINTALFTTAAQRLDLGRVVGTRTSTTLDQSVLLGSTARLPCRLLAQRVPPTVAAERRRRLKATAADKRRPVSAARLAMADWTLLVTNLPADRLTLAEALALYRARWQIELLFKRWKQDGQLDTWRSTNPWRILCEVYAKLLAAVLQQWLLLTGLGSAPDRSLAGAAQMVRAFALPLAAMLATPRRLHSLLTCLATCRARAGRTAPRRSRPATFQLLLHPSFA